MNAAEKKFKLKLNQALKRLIIHDGYPEALNLVGSSSVLHIVEVR